MFKFDSITFYYILHIIYVLSSDLLAGMYKDEFVIYNKKDPESSLCVYHDTPKKEAQAALVECLELRILMNSTFSA